MKKSIIALLLAGVLFLCGCSAMLERDYVAVSPYQSVTSSPTGTSTLRAQSYQELVTAVMYLVNEGEARGTINLYNYTSQDVEGDLSRACLEVVQKDPFGAYAVDYIRYDHSLIVSYYEVNINITYRRTDEQIASIISVAGSGATRKELQNALTSFSSGVTLHISYFDEDEEYLRDLAGQIYYSDGYTALGKPEISIDIYPDTGHQRILEIGLIWPESPEVLLQHSQTLRDLVPELVREGDTARTLYDLVLTDLTVTGNAGETSAYDALVGKAADSHGLALAYSLLCDQAGFDCVMVQGQLDGAPHNWNIVSEDGGKTWRHADLSAGLFGLTDVELTGNGAYQWDTAQYPLCISEIIPE